MRPDKDWNKEDWEFFLDVWTAIASGKEVKGINRGDVDKGLVANWKRHFTNYAGVQGAPTDAELNKRRDDLDKEKKALPETMKADMRNRKVPCATVAFRPESSDGAETREYFDTKYAMIKTGDPR